VNRSKSVTGQIISPRVLTCRCWTRGVFLLVVFSYCCTHIYRT